MPSVYNLANGFLDPDYLAWQGTDQEFICQATEHLYNTDPIAIDVCGWNLFSIETCDPKLVRTG